MWNKGPGPVFRLLLGVSSDYAQPITGQVTEVTCPVIVRAQPELTPSKRQKTGPVNIINNRTAQMLLVHAPVNGVLNIVHTVIFLFHHLIKLMFVDDILRFYILNATILCNIYIYIYKS